MADEEDRAEWCLSRGNMEGLLAVTRAKNRFSRGWDLLGPLLRDALVCREIVGIVNESATGGGDQVKWTLEQIHAISVSARKRLSEDSSGA